MSWSGAVNAVGHAAKEINNPLLSSGEVHLRGRTHQLAACLVSTGARLNAFCG
ncbi:hypothetical protein ACVW00_000050 [Marmoricola sp. URHA0025 HA25]